MDNTHRKIIELIVLYMENKISKTQQEELTAWLEKDKKNRSFFQQVISPEKRMQKFETRKHIDSERARSCTRGTCLFTRESRTSNPWNFAITYHPWKQQSNFDSVPRGNDWLIAGSRTTRTTGRDRFSFTRRQTRIYFRLHDRKRKTISWTSNTPWRGIQNHLTRWNIRTSEFEFQIKIPEEFCSRQTRDIPFGRGLFRSKQKHEQTFSRYRWRRPSKSVRNHI